VVLNLNSKNTRAAINSNTPLIFGIAQQKCQSQYLNIPDIPEINYFFLDVKIKMSLAFRLTLDIKGWPPSDCADDGVCWGFVPSLLMCCVCVCIIS
jgi:hypothetical protein